MNLEYGAASGHFHFNSSLYFVEEKEWTPTTFVPVSGLAEAVSLKGLLNNDRGPNATAPIWV